VRAHRRSAEAWHQLGLVAHQRGRVRRAERALRRAIACDDRCSEAHNRLGVLLLTQGRVDDGHACLLRAHDLAPHDTSPLLHLAQAEALRGQRDAAEAYLAAAVRLGADPQVLAAIREDLPLPELGLGDLLVGRMMGAYTSATASDFNFIPRATVVAVNQRPGAHRAG
jgi:Flp pilus assembly protein TadD